MTKEELLSKHELVRDNLPEFLEQFKEKTKDLEVEEVGYLVWKLYNKAWTDGYNRGYYDPDFEN